VGEIEEIVLMVGWKTGTSGMSYTRQRIVGPDAKPALERLYYGQTLQ
jgi:hypothetical protein